MRRKDGSDDGRPPDDWRGEKRSNETHESKTDPESKLYRKSNAVPALPSYLGHLMTDTCDTRGLVKACRDHRVTPYVTQTTARTGGSATDGRATRLAGYAIKQRKRKCIELRLGWGKLIGPILQVMVRELHKVDQLLALTMAANSLTRLHALDLRPQCA